MVLEFFFFWNVCRVQVVRTPASCSRYPWFKSRSGTIRTEKYHGFLGTNQIYKRILPEIRLWTFNFGFLQIC